MAEPCISCVIGDFGTGKTTYLAYLARSNAEKRNIFANFTLYGIEYTPISVEDLANFPDWVKDGIVLLDEGHVGANIYNVFKKDVKEFSIFISQIRKRNIYVFWSSQFFSKVAKPLRDYTKYMFQFSEIKDIYGNQIKGTATVELFDLHNYYQYINTFNFDGRPLFPYFDTKELVTNSTVKSDGQKIFNKLSSKPLTP
ncbi:MAG: hypothetical protein RBR02_10155 [Desulfuromonadaceae bacterium]|nr:hypothetical protein [Desulfuromonadaceae bacterium]